MDCAEHCTPTEQGAVLQSGVCSDHSLPVLFERSACAHQRSEQFHGGKSERHGAAGGFGVAWNSILQREKFSGFGEIPQRASKNGQRRQDQTRLFVLSWRRGYQAKEFA